jgi:beta-lactamase class A
VRGADDSVAVDGTAAGRRRFLTMLAAVLASARIRAAPAMQDGALENLAAAEREAGGRVGVFVLDTATGTRLAYRADERFAMCSTFKLLLAAAILSRIDTRELEPNRFVRYSRGDLLSNSPITEAHVGEGGLPIETLARAAVEVSDNTAANCLLDLVGGPRGYTEFVRQLGDSVTRLDRRELALNSNLPNDPRDTTTPAAMVADMQAVLLGRLLSNGSRKRLLGWMRDCRTGRERLRAGLPPGWNAGDKTGTGEKGAVNDLAILWPPGSRPPLLVACYMTGSTRPSNELAAIHGRIGTLIVRAFR